MLRDNTFGNILYVIRHCSSGMVKIGITSDWKTRSAALEVAKKCDTLKVVACEEGRVYRHHEWKLHRYFRAKRVPGTEWFHLSDRQIDELLAVVATFGSEVTWRPRECKYSFREDVEPDSLSEYCERTKPRIRTPTETKILSEIRTKQARYNQALKQEKLSDYLVDASIETDN
ncbi:GIY-YIG nuclease family protein [Synechococcus sp. AH-224-I15]|nr:GIY-YIG nuclease family protein [Synechococcus sp. AH-224-I15]